MLFFMLFVLLVLGGASFYLFCRLRPLMPMPGTMLNPLSKVIFALLMLSFVIGFVLQSRGMYSVSAPFTIVGSWMLAAILYLVIGFVLVDILRGVNAVTFRADWLTFRYDYGVQPARMASLVVCTIAALFLVVGYFNARVPVTRRLAYETDKPISRDFKYILISDIHLGMIHCDAFMELLRDRINSEPDVDFVVIAGDFFDGDPNPVINSRVGEMLREVNTGYGIFAVTGNHEWIGDADVASDFLRRHGVTVLRDSAASLPFGVSIIGRDDLSRNFRRDGRRKSISEIISADGEKDSYKIVLDHQPPRSGQTAEIVDSGVDIHLSGHTHSGAQLWPLFVFTQKMYGVHDFGQVRIGNTDFYTSAGYGTWGPPVRTSARPEMVVVEVRKRD